MRILIVDDNAAVRALARVYAEEAGAAEIVDVGDAGAALVAARAVAFDLVLVDFHMPGMTGLELTRRLLAEHPDLTIVAWTSVLDPAVEHAFVEAGAIEHVPKTDTGRLGEIIRARRPGSTGPPAAAAA